CQPAVGRGRVGSCRQSGEKSFCVFAISHQPGPGSLCAYILSVRVSVSGVFLAPGWAKASFGAAIVMIALTYTLSGRYMGSSALLFLTCPVAALVSNF